jgi:hypothetical protein
VPYYVIVLPYRSITMSIGHIEYEAPKLLNEPLLPTLAAALASDIWLLYTVNREIFAALKVGEFAFFQLAVDKIPRLLQKFNG